ncbi:MAG: 16S rRNA (cytidine(1402)-2'-O)-methyltransferase [Lachnospiraceae bacterium]|nr:16S rRNA (cytidine(1402)-2'-O)-methyltransferase [Lachnospiraceae bacterium]
MSGTLYLVATPIGNLEDMTYRAVRVLREADLIACEDTRTSRPLLSHFDIHTPTTSYHEFNKIDKAEELLDKLISGQNIAVITDAGTPGISDPGEELCARCIEAGVPVVPVPGAAAAIAAVTSSGLSCRRFAFEAFLPKDKKKRRRILEELKKETRTITIYEAPHHLRDTLDELYEALGDRRISLARELTKVHEEHLLMTLSQAITHYGDNDPRGEYVLVIEGRSIEELEAETRAGWEEMSIEDHMDIYLKQGMDKKEAMKAVAKDRGVSKRDIYQMLL